MANVQYYDVILKPVVTEKTMELMGDKKYTFLVHPEATKSQIKEAVEKMFEGTKVKSVNTMGTNWHADTTAGGNANWYGICAVPAVGYDFFSGGRISEGNNFPAAVQTILSGR